MGGGIWQWTQLLDFGEFEHRGGVLEERMHNVLKRGRGERWKSGKIWIFYGFIEF